MMKNCTPTRKVSAHGRSSSRRIDYRSIDVMTPAPGQSGDDVTALPRIPFLQLNDSIAEIREELDAAYARVMARGQFILGDETAAFEREFAAYCGATHAV